MLIHWEQNAELDSYVISCMQRAADAALSSEHVNLPCSVSVCLCDDNMISRINAQYRSIDKSTDVLSFPTVCYPQGKTAGLCEKLLRREWDDESGTCFLGDIFISVPHLNRQAAEYGHSVRREACYLLVHGICHLFGYDHIDPGDKEVMRDMEEKILSAVGTSAFSTLAPDDQKLVELAKEAMAYSYSPYSSFPVGAALHSTDGRIFLGCNIENASFGLTNCAERTAVFKAVSEGARKFDAIAISAKKVAWPCGACRQVLNEFAAPDFRIIVTWDDKTDVKTLAELLPESFGPDSM